MKLALLKGNRFNPWHLQAFNMLPSVDVTAFRAESEIQQHFAGRDDGSLEFAFEPIYFDTESGPLGRRMMNRLSGRVAGRAARILPFRDRLREFDLIQSWELFTDWTKEALEAKAKYGMPVSLMIWDNIPFNMESTPERAAIKRRALREADRFMVHTERSRRALDVEGAPEDRVVTLNPGVDVDHFLPGERKRDGLGVSDDEFVILFVGWLLPRKGLDYLILALGELLKDSAVEHVNFRLLVVGSGPGKERIDALLKRTELTERCTFAGSLPYNRMPETYRAADVFVLPSIAMPDWQEQFGMSLIEAMASGTPVVTTWSGAIPEIAGDAAVMCQPNDFVSLYEALKTLALEPRKRQELSAAGRARALEKYRLSDYAVALSELYADMVA